MMHAVSLSLVDISPAGQAVQSLFLVALGVPDW
jgi:hypothetical protein